MGIKEDLLAAIPSLTDADFSPMLGVIVLQDDSGIAYRFFEKKDWDIKLYGQYSEPITDFKGVTQDDLQYEYNKHAKEIEPLSFVLGYHWESRGINLMKASRIHKP